MSGGFIVNPKEFATAVQAQIMDALVGTARKFLTDATRRAVDNHMGPKVSEEFARKNKNTTGQLRIVTQRLKQGVLFKRSDDTREQVMMSVNGEGRAGIIKTDRGVFLDIEIQVPYAARHEYGENMRKRAFLQPAIDETMSAAQSFLDKEIKKK